MSVRRQVRFSLAILASSLLLNVLLVSCAAESPTGPPAAIDPELLAKLDAVTARLAAIEAKLDVQTDTLKRRFDTLAAKVALVPTTPGTPPAGPIAALQVAQIDSILALTSFLAHDVSSGSVELCGGIEAAGSGKVGPKADVKGEAVGSVGAWAGTGAFAGAKVDAKGGIEFELGAEVALSVEGCLPLGGEEPPARLMASGRANLMGADLHNTLSSAASQLGLTEARMSSTIGTLGSAMQSPGSLRLQDAVNMVPLAPGLQAMFSDPIGTLSAQIPAKLDEAVNTLCTRSWGSRVSVPLNTACDRIQGGAVDIGGLFTMMEQFPALQSTMATVGSRVSTVCGRVNTVGFTSLTIPNPLNIGPTPLFGPQRLFPNFTTIAC